MLTLVKQLYKLNRCLLSDDYDKALAILSKQLPLRITKIASGTKCFSWTIPKKWQVEKAQLTNHKTGKVVLDWQKNPLHLYVGSLPYRGKVSFAQLKRHLGFHSKNKQAIPYIFKYYKKDWGFCLSKRQYDALDKKATYQVTIDTKYSQGDLKIGEVIIKGKIKKEILLVAHLDHPYQANDNLSGVAVAAEVAKQLSKKRLNHTVKIVFLPETIGSVAYVWKRQRQLKGIKAVLVLDIVGNKSRILMQKTFDEAQPINYVTEQLLKQTNHPYKVVGFREKMGSDELVFNDPSFGIPAVLLSTWPYPEYHTHFDTPRIISEKILQLFKQICLNWVEMLDRDFVPKRLWRGPLMRSQFGWFLGKQPEDSQLELFGYSIDGKRTVSAIAQKLKMDIQLAFDYAQALRQSKYVTAVDS